MASLLNLFHGTLLLNNPNFCYCPKNALMFIQRNLCMYGGKHQGAQSSLRGCSKVKHYAGKCSIRYKAYICKGGGSDAIPYIQTLRKFPKEDLLEKVVLVRFDSAILFRELDAKTQSPTNALFTITYLYEAGAKVILVSDWSSKMGSQPLADIMSSVLQLKVVPCCIYGYTPSYMDAFENADIVLLENLSEVKEDLANCSKFAEQLSSGVDIFVNDSFSPSHKVLASTVGVARFCYASVAGFHFEEGLYQLNRAAETNSKPYVAIVSLHATIIWYLMQIGGGNLYDKATALHFLASRCDGLAFVGMMAFQIMHALGLPVPLHLVEHGALKEALNLIHLMQYRNIQMLYPKDFWCINISLPNQLQIFPAHAILDGWVPVDIGPTSLNEINSLLTNCKKIIWIGPVKFRLSSMDTNGASQLVQMLDKLGQSNCDITVVGTMACKSIMKESSSLSVYNMVESATVVWEFLKGRKLPGLMALDRAYPFEIDWLAKFCVPAQPLVVDIGSGNGLFLLGMARRRKDLNFLGLEINEKLVRHCLDYVRRSGIKNVYFVATNATSSFRSIVSSYPAELILVSILCPNPDFSKPEYRWRMLQRSLVEAVADLLKPDGKVFLQSDIEEVALRMKEQFLKYGKGKLSVLNDQDDAKIGQGGWLLENPFGVRSDWEQHVIDRGAPMYRLMLSKSTNTE